MFMPPQRNQERAPGAPALSPTPADKGDAKSGLRGMDFASGESALKPQEPASGKGAPQGGRPRLIEDQLARFRALVKNDGPPKEAQMPAHVEPRTPPPGLESTLTPQEYGELCARIEAGFRTDPLFAVFESMGFDPQTTMKSIEALRTRDANATYDAPEIDMLGAKAHETVAGSLGQVERDPTKYVGLLTRARSLLHFGAAAQLTHGMAGGGVGQDDELVKAAAAVVDGYVFYLKGLTTTQDVDERFQFEMATKLSGAPDLEVLEALRVLQVRAPMLGVPRGAELYAAWSAARASVGA